MRDLESNMLRMWKECKKRYRHSRVLNGRDGEYKLPHVPVRLRQKVVIVVQTNAAWIKVSSKRFIRTFGTCSLQEGAANTKNGKKN